MEVKLFEIAERIRCLREILGITVEEMAAACMVDPAESAWRRATTTFPTPSW